ncbi:MAG: SPASM domain-containing protein [Prevotella sp.]|nr:SPASM domain-containing protein [Prevotella sp.]
MNLRIPLLEEIKDICDKANVTLHCFFVTNATLLSEEVLLKLKRFNPMFQITLDGNREKHNNVRAFKSSHNGSFDTIINAFKLISEHISLTNPEIASVATIRINYDNATLRGINEIIEEIKNLDKRKFVIHLERVWQTKDKVNEEQKKLLKDTIRRLSSLGFRVGHGLFGRKSYSCPAEVYNYAIVNYDGLVYKCNGRNLEKEKFEGVISEIGDIEWNNSFLVKRTSVATFENERCINCKMLPQCMGPCSQKQIEHGWGNIDDICSLNAIDIPLEDYLTLDFETRYIIEQSVQEINP